MNTQKWTYRALHLIFLILLIGCIEPVEFDVPPPSELIIVEGSITNEDQAYQVILTRALSIGADSLDRPPVENAQVRLYDDQQNVEEFQYLGSGIYQTTGAIQGEIGRSYFIRIELEDGTIIESEPDEMKPVGTIEDIRYELEERVVEENFTDVRKDVFNVFIDSDVGSGNGNFVRWRFTGTYRIETNPEQRELILPWSDLPLIAPRPCSGYVPGPHPSGSGTIIIQVQPCTCCECWVIENEVAPQLSDDQLVADGQFNNVKVGEVPITSITLFDKYQVFVEQMSMTQRAFEFFKLIRIQKTEASNIFQPPSGELIGNVKAINSDTRVVGMFWSSAVTTQKVYITKDDVPYNLVPFNTIEDSCLREFLNATTTKPEEWED